MLRHYRDDAGFRRRLAPDGQLVVSIAKLGRDQQTLRGRPRTYERASAVIINDWESVIDNDQTELLEPLKEGVIRKEQIHELGDLLTGKTRLSQPPAGSAKTDHYYKNNSGLAFSLPPRAASCIARRLRRATTRRSRRMARSDLSAYYKAGFRPSP